MIGDKYEAFLELKPIDQLKQLIEQNNAEIYEFKVSTALAPGTKHLMLNLAMKERLALKETLEKMTDGAETLDTDGHVIDPTKKDKPEGGNASGGDGREKARV